MTEIARAPLTFGQLSVWRSIEHLPPDTSEANLIRTWELPEGTTATAVRDALDVLEARHESLRTTYVRSGKRSIEQVVWRPAGVRVPLVKVDGREKPLNDVMSEHASRGFALDREPPWRVELVTVDGRPTHLLVCIHHIAVDGAATAILYDEFLELLAGEKRQDEAPTCREIAAEQQGRTWDARTRSAVEYWRRCLADAPASERAPDATTDIRWAHLHSVPTLDAARSLATALNVSLHTVVFSAFCHTVAARDGRTSILVGLISGNRMDDRSQRLVSSVVQLVPVLVGIDPSEAFPAFAQRLQWATLVAYRHGYFDVDALHDLEAEYGRNAAGAGFRYFFNFITSDSFPKREPDEVSAGDAGWSIETRSEGRDNGFTVYLVGSAGPMLECMLRERSDETRTSATAESLTARTRELLVSLQEILIQAAVECTNGS